jgi:flavin-dependent dehydrogenase
MPAYDAIIVGLRAAGAATAMLLARAGLRVLAVDRGKYGTDTLSTHALMRAGVLQLSRWGLLPAIEAAATPPIRSTTFHYGPESLRIPIKSRDGVPSLFAPRRFLLDRLLVDAARTSGADVQYGMSVLDIIRDETGRVAGVVARDESHRLLRLEARVVIGADGLRSTVARLVRARAYRQGRHAAGVMYGYWPTLSVEGNHWYWESGIAAGAIPTNNNETCVFVAVRSDDFADAFRADVGAGYRRLLSRAAPALVPAIERQSGEAKLRGFAGERGFLRHSAGFGWALVGDAGHFKDPIIAHGITDALRDAEWLARAVIADSDTALFEYQRARDAMSMEMFDLSDEIASFNWTLATLPALHERLSDTMRREVDAVRGLAAVACPDLSLASGGAL